MTEPEDRVPRSEWFARLVSAGRPRTAPSGGWIATLFGDVLRLQESIIARDWTSTTTHAQTCERHADDALRWVGENVAEGLERRAATLAAGRVLAEVVQRADEAPPAADILARIRGNRGALDAKRRFQAALQVVPQLDQQIVHRIEERVAAHANSSDASDRAHAVAAATRSDEEVLSAGIACATRALLGAFHAEFNTAWDEAHSATTSHPVHDEATGLLDALSSSLRGCQREIFALLAAQSGARDSEQQALQLARSIPPLLLTSARWQARLDVARRARRADGIEARPSGLVAARAGSLSREAVATYAATLRIAFALRAPGSDTAVDQLTRGVSTWSDPELAQGRPLQVAAAADGDFVQIDGHVRGLRKSRTADGKLLSLCEIVDPVTGAMVTIVGLFVELARTGVTDGAYFRTHGIFRASSRLAGGATAIEMDRLALAEMAKHGAWARLLRLADTWYPVFRNQTNAEWSIGPHMGTLRKGASDIGAAEVIYLPLIRAPRASASANDDGIARDAE